MGHGERWRLRGARRAGIALAAAALTAVLLLAAVAGAATRTRTEIFNPFKSSGKPAEHVTRKVRGSCFNASLAVDRRDAWRCMNGNLIHDPCFSSAKAKRVVLCPSQGPWKHSLLEIKLTKKLPAGYQRKPSTKGVPWALTTTSGWHCILLTGATTVFHGKRQNYACSKTNDVLWGVPSRRTRLWTIYVAAEQPKKLSRRVAIRTAWF